MTTISEWMIGQLPGSISLRRREWGTNTWFIPYFQSKAHEGVAETWYGLDQDGNVDYYVGTATFELNIYRPKVKRAQYIIEGEDLVRPIMTHGFYKNDQEIKEDHHHLEVPVTFTRLPETEREFER